MRYKNVAFLMIPLLVAPLILAAGIPIADDGFVDFGFSVVDADTGEKIVSCNPIKMDVSESYSGSYYPAGVYGHGDSATGEPYLWYRFSPLSCPGYEFDHWDAYKMHGDLDYWLGPSSYEAFLGGQQVQVSSRLSDVVVSGNRLYLYMESGSSAKVTLNLRKAGYRLDVSVDPLSSGEVSPYGVGTHTVPSGTEISLTPRPNARWKFDHWTLDGSPVPYRILRFTMNEDHRVTAHFAKEERQVQPVPTESPALKICEAYPDGWPYSAKYRGYTEDMEFNSDLLDNLSGKAKYWEKDNVMLVGWMAIRPQPWSRYGVRIMEDSIVVNGTKFFSGEGRDYGVVYVECKGNYTTRVAGITKVGTRAALMWLLENQWKMREKILVVVEWQDSNLNGLMEGQEINIVFELP